MLLSGHSSKWVEGKARRSRSTMETSLETVDSSAQVMSPSCMAFHLKSNMQAEICDIREKRKVIVE